MLNASRRHLEAIVRDPEGRQVARCLVRRGRYIIGQDRKNEIVIDEGSVSARHARLTVVSDQSSTLRIWKARMVRPSMGVTLEGRPRSMPAPRFRLASAHSTSSARLPAAVFSYLPEGFLRESRYNFGEAVVEGRTSTIFNAFDTTLGRDVAIKVMRPESQLNLEHVLRFVREAQITSQLQHPGILTVYELGLNDQTQLFYTTRFVEGESLGAILDAMSSRNPVAIAAHSLGSLLTAWQKACDAVAYANAHGVIHAGLRPDSITLGLVWRSRRHQLVLLRVSRILRQWGKTRQPVQAAPIDAIPPLQPYCPPEIAGAAWDEVSGAHGCLWPRGHSLPDDHASSPDRRRRRSRTL
jgi:hypothetical protein